ncbi:DUF4230 domain-containing protein [Lachnospiraceae bacterium HCP1S3_C3]|nr:DUF4230 domain-containing protein [Lachnospiraceae bacterium]MDD6857380.1 DUF4230 domain-containing protein [Lachnospiraceae bacterium]
MKKLIKFLLPVVLVGIVGCIIYFKCDFFSQKGKAKTQVITSSTLVKAIDVAELSTAKFTYNGIAQVHEDDDNSKCSVRYSATVKAGIDMSKVNFEIDNDNKTIKPILPELSITSNTVDEKSLSFIPEDAEVNLKDAIIECEKDAESEAEKSEDLVESAKENLQSIIEALLLPVVSPQGYKIVWE